MSQFTIPTFQLPALVARIGQHLPQWPHSLALCGALNGARRLGLLAEDSLSVLEGKTFRVVVTDTGGSANFTYQGGWFKPLLHAPETPDLTFQAALAAYLQLLTRQEDPDTLFFNRQLSIEGDTELGLVVKNMLDAIEWPPRLPGLDGLLARLGGRDHSPTLG